MPVMAMIILGNDERAAALSLNSSNVAKVNPRLIDNSLSNSLGHGQLQGKYVLPAHLLNSTDYQAWFASLSALPMHILDSEILFLPAEV